MRSDELFTEINHVLRRFGKPFLAQLQVRLNSVTLEARLRFTQAIGYS